MHLDRKHFTRVEEFQQQWESTKTAGQFSQQLLRKLLQQLTDGSPFERSIGNATRMVIAVAEHPGFADGTITRQRRGEQVGQTPAAPEPILIDWFESQGIQKLLSQELSLLLLRTVGRPYRPERCLCANCKLVEPPVRRRKSWAAALADAHAPT